MNNYKRSTYISSPTRSRLTTKRRKSVFWPKFKRFFQAYKTPILILIALFLVVIIVKLVLNFTVGKAENIIQEVIFTDENVQQYDNKTMYGFIREELNNKNVIVLNMQNGGDSKDMIQTEYPFIKDMNISKIGPSKVSVSLEFYPTDLVFKNEYISIGYSNKFLFRVSDSNAISSGALFLELPAYFSGEKIQTNVTGYLSLLNPEKLKSDFTIVKNAIQPEAILYLAGAQKSVVTAGNKRITFDHRRSIAAQVEYLQHITEIDPALFYEIDLTTFPKVIIKKTEGGFSSI